MKNPTVVSALLYPIAARENVPAVEPFNENTLFESIAASSPLPMLIARQNPERLSHPLIRYANEAFYKTFGYRVDEIVGESPAILHLASLPKSTVSPIESIYEALEEQGSAIVELPLKHRDGHIIYAELAVYPIKTRKPDRHPSWLFIYRDITVRKEKEEKLSASTQRAKMRSSQLAETLEKERKVSALQGEFVSMASHELRTPLSIIHNCTRLLARHVDTDNKTEIDHTYITRQMDKIDRAVIRMTDLIESTLNLARLEQGSMAFHPKPFPLHSFLQNIIFHLADIFSRNHLILECDAPVTVVGDASMLEQVFTNLITNACKYSAEGDEIIIRVRKFVNEVRVSIIDRGIGIPKLDINHVCEKFFRAGNAAGMPGTGIGLYLCNTFVELHGGHMEIRSEEGKGSEFIVTLLTKH